MSNNFGLWRSAIDVAALEYRNSIFKTLRNFFSDRGVLEVDVPLLGKSTVTDPNIDTIVTCSELQPAFLQTSPEIFMKRLLASGTGDIFTLTRAFRSAEEGVLHNPEFTLLEWYRIAWDEHRLMEEVAELISSLMPSVATSKISYAQIFRDTLGLDPHDTALENLQNMVNHNGLEEWSGDTRSNCLNVLFERLVQPSLPDGLFFVYEYPACQAALANLHMNKDGQTVSRRFEVFLNRIELANGYFELTDLDEHRKRFEKDREERINIGKPIMENDKYFLDALESGLPSCSGVALGVDRLLMQLLGVTKIDHSMPFSWERC